ncbi:MAG: hypothetical protein HQL08_08345 [Nitrospirae bacterium]|nr:hypothetical protein [Nitrospirota bacterium]
MMDKKEYVRINEEKLEDSSPFAPLALYDDLAAKEVEDLRMRSDALSKEIEALTAELGRLTAHIERGSSKERLSSLYSEQAQYDKKILELRNELPRLGEECTTLRLAIEQSCLEEKLNLVSTQLEELRGKREILSREIPVIESETAACERFIEESETLLMETPSAIAEIERQSKLLVSKNESLERLEEMMYLVSTIEGIGQSGEDVHHNQASTYSVEVADLEDGLKKKDMHALSKALDIAGRLAQEYGHIGMEINELLHLLISKFSFMQELEKKEQLVVLLNAQSEELQAKVVIKTEAIEELRAVNREDKKRFVALQDEISHYRNAIAPYADEVAKGDEIIRKKEAAVAEFVSLFVQKAELEAMAQAVDGKMRAFKDMAGGMV